jgi:hypothetical protein
MKNQKRNPPVFTTGGQASSYLISEKEYELQLSQKIQSTQHQQQLKKDISFA